jgi:integrase
MVRDSLPHARMRLYDDHGHRLYIDAGEREALLAAASAAPRDVKCLAHVLIYTGARISEALALHYGHIDLSGDAIRLRSLKKRQDADGKPRVVFRSVPVPSGLIDMLDMVYGVREVQARGRRPELEARLFPIGRTKAWQDIKKLMDTAGIAEGAHKTPHGLRHGFGVNAVQSGVQLNMLQKWMGHANIQTTAIYANATGQEERAIASRMW